MLRTRVGLGVNVIGKGEKLLPSSLVSRIFSTISERGRARDTKGLVTLFEYKQGLPLFETATLGGGCNS